MGSPCLWNLEMRSGVDEEGWWTLMYVKEGILETRMHAYKNPLLSHIRALAHKISAVLLKGGDGHKKDPSFEGLRLAP